MLQKKAGVSPAWRQQTYHLRTTSRNMRIISGKAKGRRLAAPPGRTQDIRPTSDRAREALFNILGDSVPGSHVLDLYAGTGALGLEALSRGAATVVLVDLHRQALELIRRNIAICVPAAEQAKVTLLRHDLRKGLPPALTTATKATEFDLIFLDPPYSQGLSLKTLEYLGNGQILSAKGLVVAEERSNESLPERCGMLHLFDQRTYGDTGFWFYAASHRSENSAKERT